MPFLIDGNNLMYALRDVGLEVGRGGLCRLLGKFASSGQKVRVVFDGTPPYGPLAQQIQDDRIDVKYSAGRTADDVIIECIAADSAPRRLTLVSTDHEIRDAGRSRKCKLETSENFAKTLVRMLEESPKNRPSEPPEKRVGLAPEQTRAWLKELNVEEDNDQEDSLL
jgi:predicted RNA-binding protein with PIN domain